MKPSEQLRELVEKWRKEAIEHNRCAPEMAQPRNFLRECAFELVSVIPAVEQLEQTQHERDEVLRNLAKNVINAESRTDGLAPPRWVVIAMHAILHKLGGVE